MVKAYHRPARLGDALKLLSDSNDKNVPLAGGTTLALNPRGVDGLVDLSALGFSYIRAEQGTLRIGATTPIREVQRSEAVRQFAKGVLAESSKNYLTALIRNRATIGGVLAAGNFWADFVSVLVALNASVKIFTANNGSDKPKENLISVEDLVQKGPRKSLWGGILYEVVVPVAESSAHFAYQRVAKVETDISILSAVLAARLSGKSVRSAVLVVGNGARPIRLKSAEDRIKGKSVLEAAQIAAAAARDIPAESDIRASAEYRKEVSAVLVRRLFDGLA